jgi:choline dehydrogenase-like flavoprotein
VPFDAIDYEARLWVPESGWPVTAEEMRPYLDRAAPYLGISLGTGYNDEGFWKIARRRRPMPMFDESRLRSYYWAFSRDPDNAREHMRLGNHLPRWAGDDVTLVTNATVCRIEANEDATLAEAVEIAAPDGARYRLGARFIVLCAGGIETPRLLLCSNTALPAGLGNARGQVGRYLMDHLRGPVASFPLPGTRALRRQFGHYRIAGGQVFVHGMQMSETIQRDEALLNSTAWLEGRISSDDPYYALKRWARLKPELPGDALCLARNLGLLAQGARDYFVSRNGLPRKIERLNLVAMCEQLPDAESRVTLSDQCDRLGLPRARIDWRVHEQEERSLRRITQLVAEEFSRLGLPAPVADDWIRDDAPLPQDFRDVAHPTGTTRMGRDQARAVVDENCHVHGMRNLYVAGSAVFPTSSHANPTQMIVALAIRLADELKGAARWNMNIRTDSTASV